MNARAWAMEQACLHSTPAGIPLNPGGTAADHGYGRLFDLLPMQFSAPCAHSIHQALETLFREFRTKSDEIGAFPNELSCWIVLHLIVIRDDAKHESRSSRKNRKYKRFDENFLQHELNPSFCLAKSVLQS